MLQHAPMECDDTDTQESGGPQQEAARRLAALAVRWALERRTLKGCRGEDAGHAGREGDDQAESNH
jgi:hypothetical protein